MPHLDGVMAMLLFKKTIRQVSNMSCKKPSSWLKNQLKVRALHKAGQWVIKTKSTEKKLTRSQFRG